MSGKADQHTIGQTIAVCESFIALVCQLHKQGVIDASAVGSIGRGEVANLSTPLKSHLIEKLELGPDAQVGYDTARSLLSTLENLFPVQSETDSSTTE